MKKVILLDIDGVLVHHGGYRAALHATLNHFASLMGLSHFDFPEEKLAELEKRGIFSEWDMVPLLLATLWNDILSHRPNLKLPADLYSAAVEIGRNVNGYMPRELIIPEFEYIARSISRRSRLAAWMLSIYPNGFASKYLESIAECQFFADDALVSTLFIGQPSLLPNL